MLGDRVRRKREICACYADAIGDPSTGSGHRLPGVRLMPEASWGRCTRWLSVITVDPAQFGATREDIRLALEREDIESRPLWKPMHLRPVFAGCEATLPQPLPAREGGSVAEAPFSDGLWLPSGTALSVGDLARVVGVVRDAGRG